MSSENTPSSSTKALLMIVFILMVAATGILYRKDAVKQVSVPTKAGRLPSVNETASPTVSRRGGISAQGVMQIRITEENNRFFPTELSVKKGIPLSLVFESKDGNLDIVFEGLAVKTEPVSSGKSVTVTFTPQQAGEFVFYDSIPSSSARGKLIVRNQ